MSDAQTEARAIARLIERLNGEADAFERGSDETDPGTAALLRQAATALAAKDAELERRDMQLEASAKVALDLSAQIAEANKALEPFADIADMDDAVGRDDPDDDRVWVYHPHDCLIGVLTFEDFRAARRALTGGQEE